MIKRVLADTLIALTLLTEGALAGWVLGRHAADVELRASALEIRCTSGAP